MNRVSLRQPIILYSVVFMMAFAALAMTLSAFSLVQASRRAYRRAALNELTAISLRGPSQEVAKWLSNRPKTLELDVEVVMARRNRSKVDIAQVREAAHQPSSNDELVAIPLVMPGEEAYLVGHIDRFVPISIAFAEIGRLIPFVMIGALACSVLMAFMLNRLVLPPLSILGQIAKDSVQSADVLEPSDAPNEIIEIARRFRSTVRQLQEERENLAHQKAELERMQESLIRASKLASVGRLAAGIAHEIGNPLAAVLGYLSLLGSGLDAAAQKDVVERSTKELTRIAETIRKLLTYARKGEEVTEPPFPVSTRRVLDDALSLVRGHPALRGVVVHDPPWTDQAPDVLGHPGRLIQVLVNLFLNAAQAMETSEEKEIVLERETLDNRVCLRIRDTGPGIAPEILEQIFDPFFTTKEPGEGTGLGLAVSRSLVEAMGGELSVSSQPGQGACFIISLRPA